MWRRQRRVRVKKDERAILAYALVCTLLGSAQLAAVVDKTVLEPLRIRGRCIAKAVGGATLGSERQKLISRNAADNALIDCKPVVFASHANALPRLLARGHSWARAMLSSLEALVCRSKTRCA